MDNLLTEVAKITKKKDEKKERNLSIIVQKNLNAIYSLEKIGSKIDEVGPKKVTKLDELVYPLFIWKS